MKHCKPNHNKIKSAINHKQRPLGKDRYEDFVIKQFKNDPEFLKLCLKKSFQNYINQGDRAYFVEVLEKAIKAHGVSKIAKESGIARQHIYKISSKEFNPTLENFIKLMEAFKIKLSMRG